MTFLAFAVVAVVGFYFVQHRGTAWRLLVLPASILAVVTYASIVSYTQVTGVGIAAAVLAAMVVVALFDRLVLDRFRRRRALEARQLHEEHLQWRYARADAQYGDTAKARRRIEERVAEEIKARTAQGIATNYEQRKEIEERIGQEVWAQINADIAKHPDRPYMRKVREEMAEECEENYQAMRRIMDFDDPRTSW